MRTLAATIGTLCLLFTPVAALAMTDAECTAAWKAAHPAADGNMTEAEGSRYFAAMRVANKPFTGTTLTQTDFLANCKAGVFNAALSDDSAAPLAGANSFTEAQAKDRAVAAGLSNVSALTKDDKGVWRGTASNGTKRVSVAIDFKGNVVAK